MRLVLPPVSSVAPHDREPDNPQRCSAGTPDLNEPQAFQVLTIYCGTNVPGTIVERCLRPLGPMIAQSIPPLLTSTWLLTVTSR